MTVFASLMRRADDLLRGEDDQLKAEWWRGYKRGLRRAHHGERFGSSAEHATWIAAAESDDQARRAMGLGYAAGLTLEPHDPPASFAPSATARSRARFARAARVLGGITLDTEHDAQLRAILAATGETAADWVRRMIRGQ